MPHRPVDMKPATYQLTTEDYESIWLRVKEKFKVWVLGWVVFITGVIGFGLYNLYLVAREKIDKEVTKYVQSPEFRKSALPLVYQKLATYDERLKLNEHAFRRVDSIVHAMQYYEAAPFRVTEHGFVLVGSDGLSVTVEFGEGETSDTIQFQNRFLKAPSVLVAPAWPGYSPYRYDRTGRPAPVFTTWVTDSNFVAGVHQEYRVPHKIHWVALGR
jgi:hypothetical protein